MVILNNPATHVSLRSSDLNNSKCVSRQNDFNCLYTDNVDEPKRQVATKTLSYRIPNRGDIEPALSLDRNCVENAEDNNASGEISQTSLLVEKSICKSTTSNTLKNDSTIFFSELYGFRVDYPKSSSHSWSSEEEIRSNIGDNLLRRYISRTVNGWDRLGMHYWLHKVGKSNLQFPLTEKIECDSWYRIHVCDKCTKKLHTSHNLNFILHDKQDDTDNETLLHTVDYPEGDNVIRDTRTNDFKTTLKPVFNSLDLSTQNDEQNNQFFQRVVYCYNTCGLNFNLFDSKEQTRKKIQNKSAEINPFMKVVVYGTDPCGLKFPIELDDKEPVKGDCGDKLDNTVADYGDQLGNTEVNCLSTVSSMHLQCVCTKHDNLFEVNTNSQCVINENSIENISKAHVFYKEELETHIKHNSYVNSTSYNNSNDSTVLNFTLTNVNGYENSTTSVTNSESTGASQEYLFGSDYSMYNNYSIACKTHSHSTLKYDESTTGPSIDTDLICSNFKLTLDNVSQNNCISKTDSQSVYEYREQQTGTKIASSKRKLPLKKHVLYIRSDTKSNISKKRLPFVMWLSKNDDVIRMISFGKRKYKILPNSQSKKEKCTANAKVNVGDQIVIRIRSIILFAILILVLIGFCILIEDSIIDTIPQPPEPVKNWYFF